MQLLKTYRFPIAVVLLIILNFVLKYLHIDAGPISGDEPFTLYHAQGSWEHIWNLMPKENNPPLHFILMKIWTTWFGNEVVAARMSSLIFSSLTAPLILLILKRKSFYAGLLAALMYTASTFHMYFAHEARTYALLVFLFTLTLYAYLNSDRNKAYKVLFMIGSILMMYTHFFGILTFGTIAFYHLFLNRQDTLKDKITLLIVPILFFTPYLSVLIKRFSHASKGTWLTAPSWSEPYETVVKFFNKPVIAVIFIAIILISVPVYIRLRKKSTLYTQRFFGLNYLLILVLLLGTFSISFWIPMYLDRYLLIASIPLYLIISLTLHQLSKNLKNNVLNKIYLSFCLPLFFTLNLDSGIERSKENAYPIIREEVTLGHRLIVQPKWLDKEISYHFYKDVFENTTEFETLSKKQNLYSIYSDSEIEKILTDEPKTVTAINCGQASFYSHGYEKDLEVIEGKMSVTKWRKLP